MAEEYRIKWTCMELKKEIERLKAEREKLREVLKLLLEADEDDTR